VRVALRAIVIAYLIIGSMYAVATPPWQVPDEPAHYNYVRHVALYGTLPELRPGDYPAAYLEEIKARRFAPELSIEPIRYESHQPPLYYILAAALYRAASSLALPDLVVLRAFSVFLGALTLLVAFQLIHALGPRDPVLALGASAFAAALPMHVAMSAAVNNDTLAGLFVATIAWRLIPMTAGDWTPRRALGLGALLGLAFLTKMQSYVAFAMVATALLWDLGYAQRWRPLGGWRRVAEVAVIVFGTALLMALPWLLRNTHLYGLDDPLGLARHDRVVAGQLTTGEFLAQRGWPALVTSFVRTTFQSFWGVFGWMGVPMPPRVYQALGVLTLLAAFGLGLYAWRAHKRSRLPEAEGLQVARDGSQATASAHPDAWNLEPAASSQLASHPERRRATRGRVLLLVWMLGTGAGYLWWNTTYLQHQGRYLFPAIIPIGLAVTVGLREVYRRPPRHLLPALGLAAATFIAVGMALGDVPWFAVALTALTGGTVWAAQHLEGRWPDSALALTYACLAALTLFALHAYVIPYLTP